MNDDSWRELMYLEATGVFTKIVGKIGDDNAAYRDIVIWLQSQVSDPYLYCMNVNNHNRRTYIGNYKAILFVPRSTAVLWFKDSALAMLCKSKFF